jgi:DtxR family Mn-dependent transcriptional regulator
VTRKLSDVQEMYLKTVLVLEREYKPVRPSQIAKVRGVSAASVTEAIRTLQDKGLILRDTQRGIRLSARGRTVARRVEGRYEVLRYFLREILGGGERVARRDACEIEHVASPETIDRLTAFVEFVHRCKMDVPEVVSHFHDYYARRAEGSSCADCEGGDKSLWSLKKTE